MLISLPALGASSFLGGISGSIFTPDGVIVPTGTWEVSYHRLGDMGSGDKPNTLGVMYGIADRLEVGASFVNDGGSDTAFNAKLRLLPETASQPTILVGVFDVAGSVSDINTDPGLFVVFSKNMTSVASDVAGEPSKPLRLSAGFGSGVFDGSFAGLDWTLDPRLSLMAEFFGGNIGGDESLFNAGIRYAASDTVRLDVAAIDWDEIAFGASLRFGY